MFSYFDFIDAEKRKLFTIDPFVASMVQPCSIDVRLDNKFCIYTSHKYAYIDPSVEQPELTQEVEVEYGVPFILHPGEFVLGSTQEVVTLSQYVAAVLNGKSSLGRLGIQVHSTAGVVDPGFAGNITLELSNVNNLPVKLWPGMKIGQLNVFKLNQVSPIGYGDTRLGSRYQGQRGPTPSRSYRNFSIKQPENQES